ncbi:MAG: hypothetical protein PHS74_00375 [Lachnospiraceae bacterium]|nr:hypothetical protein [Lachnospiraceae bacterium]
MKNNILKIAIISGAVATTGICLYFGIRNCNEFAKYVMEHPEEFKVYQNVERINKLTNQVTSLTNTNASLNKTITDLTSENKNLTEKLKVFVTKEYSELFTNGELTK